MPSVFVQIASYRDPECQWTVKDLFEKAANPDAIRVGICWQRDPVVDADCFLVPSPRPSQTFESFVLPEESQGVCWARAEVQKFYSGEDYVLMIDSHMRFVEGWDSMLIAELAECASDKPMLSCYPPAYTPPHNLSAEANPRVMCAKPFRDNGDIRFDGITLRQWPERPLRGAFLAAGFIFAPGRFVEEVPYDPHLYFEQEEACLAVRAYSHGWDVYSAVSVFLYHHYFVPGEAERPLHWSDCPHWVDYAARSRGRYQFLLRGIEPDPGLNALVDIEKFGLGSSRSLDQFETFSGLDFAQSFASERALQAEFIEGIEDYR